MQILLNDYNLKSMIKDLLEKDTKRMYLLEIGEITLDFHCVGGYKVLITFENNSEIYGSLEYDPEMNKGYHIEIHKM